MNDVRLYGRMLGYGSHAGVTRGFKEELERHGLLAGVVSLDAQAPPGHQVPGAQAKVGLFTGPLGAVAELRRAATHERRYAMVAPNSTKLPQGLVALIESVCTHVLVPSKWAASVAEQHFDVPVEVVPHGLSPGLRPRLAIREMAARAYDDDVFIVAHLSTTERQRKGTVELVQAWEQITSDGKLPKRSRLDLILDMDAKNRMVEWFVARGGIPQNIELYPRANLAPARMGDALSTAHVVCQPSRGEGFGLVPLEARAVGVPVVATACTGHSEHLLDGQPGVVIVPHGPMAPIDDLPDAEAPIVVVDALAACLVRAYEDWKQLDSEAQAASERVREQWSWQAQLGPFMQQLKGQAT